MATREQQVEQDVKDLHGLGYAQELLRTMGGFSNFAISFSIISILTGAVILYDYGLAWAGTAAVVIGWPLVTVFVLAIAASMAELASAYPTAGGLYYWASKMKNKNWGWWTAWFNLDRPDRHRRRHRLRGGGLPQRHDRRPALRRATSTAEIIPASSMAIWSRWASSSLIQIALNIAGINRSSPAEQPGQRLVAHRHRRGRGRRSCS